MITYKGIDYPTRTFDAMIEGTRQTITIAPESITEEFGPDPDKWDEEAKQIDETLYFYLPNKYWDLSDAEIAKNHLDDSFELSPDEDDDTTLINDMKTTFDFYIDQKITTWERKKFSIASNTKEEAETVALKLFDGGDDDLENDTDFYYEQLDNASHELTPEENKGDTTRQLYLDDILIKSNGKT